MPSVPQETVIALGVAIAVLVVGVLVARWINGRVGWPGAGGAALIAATPLLPHAASGLGVSLDDVLPALGLSLLVPMLLPLRLPSQTRLGRWPLTWGATIALAGAGILVVAELLSAFA